MRRKSIIDLVEHSKNDLVKIKSDYEASIKEQKVSPSLQINIKNMMENLRSALDYVAHDIYDKIIYPYRATLGEKQISDVYFPYGKDENGFNSSIGRNLPKISSLSPPLYSIIERIQPHKCKNDWLYNFCTILNQNKHNTLSPQKKNIKKSFQVGLPGKGPSISAPAGAIIASPGSIRIGNHPVIFDPNTGIPIQTPGLEVKVTVWVSFLFADTLIEVLPLLQLATKEIEQVAHDTYSLI